jgi:hypothetical protein
MTELSFIASKKKEESVFESVAILFARIVLAAVFPRRATVLNSSTSAVNLSWSSSVAILAANSRTRCLMTHLLLALLLFRLVCDLGIARFPNGVSILLGEEGHSKSKSLPDRL